MASVLDLFLFLFAVLYVPIKGALTYRGLKRSLVTNPGHRLKWYRRANRLDSLTIVMVLLLWFYEERSFAELGLVLSGGLPGLVRLSMSLAVAVLLALLIKMAHRWELRNKRKHGEMINRLRYILPVLPHTQREMDVYPYHAISTGLSEELLFRAFMLWYLHKHMNLFLAVVLSSILFGFGHLYQGWRGVKGTTIYGLVFASVYLAAGSLWIPVFLHAFNNLALAQFAFALAAAHPKAVLPQSYGYRGKRALQR